MHTKVHSPFLGYAHHKYTGSAKTDLIAHDRKFDVITQTQSLMNALSNITAIDNQSKGICFF